MSHKPIRTRGGTIVQAGLNGRVSSSTKHKAPAGIRRAVVINTYVTDSAETRSGINVECDVVLLSGPPLRKVPVLQSNHGVNNLHTPWIPKPTTRAIDGSVLNLDSFSRRGTFIGTVTSFNQMDGDMVGVEFVDSSWNFPVITRAFTHEQTKRLVTSGTGWAEGSVAERGDPKSEEYYVCHNGTEVRINGTGDVLIDTVAAHHDLVDENPATGQGQVRIRVKDGQRFTVAMGDDDDVLEVFKAGSQLRIDLGEGATERVVLGDSFLSFLNGFISKYIAHTHATGVGPTSTPLDLPPQSLMTDALLSDLAKTKKT